MLRLLKWIFLSSILHGAVLSLPACAADETLAPKPDKYEVVAFSAPWCYPCKKEIPQVDRAATAKGVKFTVYIVSGTRPGARPTQADADRYRQDLHLTAEVKPDIGMALYEKYVSEGNHYVPMGASLDAAGNVSRVFGPGRLDVDLVDYINGR